MLYTRSIRKNYLIKYFIIDIVLTSMKRLLSIYTDILSFISTVAVIIIITVCYCYCHYHYYFVTVTLLNYIHSESKYFCSSLYYSCIYSSFIIFAIIKKRSIGHISTSLNIVYVLSHVVCNVPGDNINTNTNTNIINILLTSPQIVTNLNLIIFLYLLIVVQCCSVFRNEILVVAVIVVVIVIVIVIKCKVL
jgi:hypothetical protein